MPFTFSHPAIVLPLTFLPRKWYSLTGLVIGTVTPDFEYFLRMKVQSSYSHTISGIFWFDLPLGLLLAYVFHTIVRDSLYDNLPLLINSKFLIFKQFDWNHYFKKNWIIVSISILIGVASHVFWDSFTHKNGYFVQIIPLLNDTLNLLGTEIPYFKIVQHSSSLIGALVIAFTLFKLPSDKNAIGKVNLKYWIILTALTFTIVGIRLLNGLYYRLYGHLIVSIISAILISLILTPIFTRKNV